MEERILQEIQAVLVEVVLQAEVHQGIQAVVRQAAQATQLQAVTEDAEGIAVSLKKIFIILQIIIYHITRIQIKTLI